MIIKWKLAALVFVATALCLFGTPGRAKANAITVGRVQQVQGQLKIEGNGTFSLNAGRTLDSIKMKVYNLGGQLVDDPVAIIPQGTTEWAAVSKTLTAGQTYWVTAEIKSHDANGNSTTTQAQNGMQITIQ